MPRRSPRPDDGPSPLRRALPATVRSAGECLVVMGSRSRDVDYLATTEAVLAERPSLIYYRVLFGPPHHQVLKDHLVRLLRLRDPGRPEPGGEDPASGAGG